MNRLLDAEWETLNNIILEIYEAESSHDLRLSFLKNLRALVAFDVGEFSLIDDSYTLQESVEVNFIGTDLIGIADRYNDYKKTHGKQVTDFIWQYPKSFIASNSTILQREEYAKEADFNLRFVKSIGMTYCCTVTLWKRERLWGEFSLYLSSQYDFTEKDLYVIGQLKDHLANRLSSLHAEHQDLQIRQSQMEFLLNHHLTDRELQVITMMMNDYSQTFAADQLCISVNTLKKHVSNIYKKLGIRSKSELKQLLHKQ